MAVLATNDHNHTYTHQLVTKPRCDPGVQAEAVLYRPAIPSEGGLLPPGYSLAHSGSNNNTWSAWHRTASGRRQQGFLHGPHSI
ncbi:hypothetical protein ACRRTK_001712 [Alexandromys fortis]